jgi:hypothetical protein
LPGSHSKFTNSVYSALARASNHPPPRFPLEPRSVGLGGWQSVALFLTNGGALFTPDALRPGGGSGAAPYGSQGAGFEFVSRPPLIHSSRQTKDL